jgi:protein DGCR14
MVDRVARNKRVERATRVTKTPVNTTPRFASSPRVDELTPRPGSGKMLTSAAQNLLSRVGSTPRASGGSTGLKNMWTPTPRRK